MSLPWFPFNADAYTGDTSHLTCEEHGAYLLLMLAYYRSEKPLPSRDRSLAATCKLSLDVWMEAKPALSPFFRDEGGFWHHDVIDETIRTQNARMESNLEYAKAGAAKRWAGHTKKPRKKATAMPPALPEHRENDEKSMPQQCASDADIDKEVEEVKVNLNQESSLSARERETDLIVEGAQKPPAPAPGVGSPISVDWVPMPEWSADVISDGATADEIAEQTKTFIAHHQESGAFSNNWDASWVKWWARYVAWKAKQKPKAKPRIEVNHVPSESQYREGMKRYAAGMSWMRRLLGPEPGQTGCLVPREIIIEFGYDPETGMKVRS